MNAGAQAGKGTYLLLARLDDEAVLQVGKLGSYRFPRGWYAYAGSALGPGGLEARLARHRRAEKRLHWHIDYLLQRATLESTWQVAHPQRLECAWAAAVQGLPGAQAPVRGFGASDCRCTTHLAFFACRPTDPQITAALARRTPAGAELLCLPGP
jgi:Uri superfamily endonuclease